MALLKSSDSSAGGQALARGAWAEARAAFETELRIAEMPGALEGLGKNAAWWLDLTDLVFDSRERSQATRRIKIR